MTILIKENIAKTLAKSMTGMRFEEIRREIKQPENIARFELKEMETRGYVKRTGVTASTRYNLTPQGRLLFIANSEESALTQTEKTPSETTEPAPIAEESALEQIVNDELGKLADIKYTDDSIARLMCSVAHERIDGFEDRLFTEDFETRLEPTKSRETDDEINNPSHYHGETMDVIDVIDDFLTPKMIEGYLIGNVLKYVLRYQKKGGVQSLKKAQWYLNRTIQDFDLFNEANS